MKMKNLPEENLKKAMFESWGLEGVWRDQPSTGMKRKLSLRKTNQALIT